MRLDFEIEGADRGTDLKGLETLDKFFADLPTEGYVDSGFLVAPGRLLQVEGFGERKSGLGAGVDMAIAAP